MTTRLLLNPALPFTERLLLFVEGMAAICEALDSIKDIPPISERRFRLLDSMIEYELAGCPYGRNHKGRKKWQRLQKFKEGL